MVKQKEVIALLKTALSSTGRYHFTLQEVSELYRKFTDEPLPFRDLGCTSVRELLSNQCDFVVISDNPSEGHEVVLKPPAYEDAGMSNEETDPNGSDLFDQVHDALPASFVRFLKMFIHKIGARDGITIPDFEAAINREAHKPLDYKGFSREKFFRGLSDVFEVRRENKVLKLYPAGASAAAASATAARTETAEDRIKRLFPPSFQNVLAHKIRECCRTPRGVSYEDFRTYFNATSPQALRTGGLDDDSFFRGLPHIFRVVKADPKGEPRLFPATMGQSGLARQNAAGKSSSVGANLNKKSAPAANWRSTMKLAQAVEDDGRATAKGKQPLPRANARKEESSSPSPSAPSPAVEASAAPVQVATAKMSMLKNGQELWIISFGDGVPYVPTGCIAKLAELPRDTVEMELRRNFLKISVYKKLHNPNVKQTLSRNGVADGEVLTYPLPSVPAIIRLIQGKQTNESVIDELVHRISDL